MKYAGSRRSRKGAYRMLYQEKKAEEVSTAAWPSSGSASDANTKRKYCLLAVVYFTYHYIILFIILLFYFFMLVIIILLGSGVLGTDFSHVAYLLVGQQV